MRGVAAVVLAASLLMGAAGCAASPETSVSPTSIDGIQKIDPTLIPTAPPATVVDVDASGFKTSYGDYIFRVGDGPTWCTISPDFGYTVCEQSEVATQYEPIPMPASCDYSYGYQVRLWGTQPETGDIAEFPCSGGAFSDPTGAQTLLDGQRVTVAPFTCFVDKATARCENETGDYVVLGPQAWALSPKK
jgi:hypothetical protein